jgi:hypothetical protein
MPSCPAATVEAPRFQGWPRFLYGSCISARPWYSNDDTKPICIWKAVPPAKEATQKSNPAGARGRLRSVRYSSVILLVQYA